MLNLKNLTLAYGPKILIQNATLQLYKNQIVGLVGKNGAGKTSLFKLILEQIHPEAGEYFLPANTLISYIEQEIVNFNQILIEYVLLAHRIYAEQHTDLPEYYQLRPNAEKLLINLGFKLEELEQPLHTFSGGWQMRANLAKALFCHSDLLLLDEPTNHLDLETVVWLESWLKRYTGLALIISHDREFLDNVTTHTLNIAKQQLNLYNGNYSTFARTLAEQEILQQKMSARTKAQIDHLQSFVDRFRAKASKAKQAQSRMKMIEKLRLAPTINNERNYNIEFLTPEYTPNLLLSLVDGVIGYPNKTLITQANWQIFAHDRIGLLGKNGRGKTSLIKALLDKTSLIDGVLEINPKIKIGYFAQQTVDQLALDDTPFQLLRRTTLTMREQDIYTYLGRFGFAFDIAKQSIANFSGGEKARLILALIIIARPNILFLDEPTNHLDMEMREELAAALQDFEGAVILVSHDKFLLQSVVDDLYVIDEQRLQQFTGSLDDYQDYLLAQDTPTNNKVTKKKTKQVSNPSNLNQQIKNCEKEIAKLQTQIDKLNQELSANSSNFSRLAEVQTKLEQLNQKLQRQEEIWLNLHED